MSERLNLVEERRAIGRYGALRTTERMKAAQRASLTTLVLFIPKRKVHRNTRRDNTRHMTPFLVTEYQGERHFHATMAARAVTWILNRRTIRWRGAQIIGEASIIDQSAPDINKLGVPYQLAFSASATIVRRKVGAKHVC